MDRLPSSRGATARYHEDSHEETVDMIERDIMVAQAALSRNTAGPTGADRCARTTSGARATYTAGAVEAGSGAQQDGPSPRRALLEDTRRRQLLAQLARDRAERRGFASERELRLAENDGAGMAARRTGGAAVAAPAPPRAPPRNPAAIQQALQDAASAAVASALDKALASLGTVGSTSSAAQLRPSAGAAASHRPAGRGGGRALGGQDTDTRTTPPPPQQLPHHEQVRTTAVQLGGVAEPVVADRGWGPPVQEEGGEGGRAGHAAGLPARQWAAQTPQEKEELIAALLAERRSKLRSDGRLFSTGTGGGGEYRAADVRVPTMPPIPPLVAALQAQARQAADMAASAAQAAAQAALQQQVVEAGIAEQRRVLSLVSHGNADALAAASVAAQEAQVVSARAEAGGAGAVEHATAATSPGGDRHAASRAGGRPSPGVRDRSPRAGDKHSSRWGGPAHGAGPAAQASAERYFRRPTKEEVKAEREAALYGECTFQPGLHAPPPGHSGGAAALHTQGPSSAAGAAPPTPPRLTADRLAALARTKAEAWRDLDKQREADEREKLKTDCTFQPNASYDVTTDKVVGRDGKVYVSTTESSLQWEESRAKRYIDGPLKQYKESSSSGGGAAGVTHPTPSPPPAPSGVSPPPQATRAQPPARVQASNTKQHQTAAASAPLTGMPPPLHNPPLTPAVPAVAARLFAEADRRAVTRAKAKAVVEQQSMAQLTFKPSLNPVSLALVQRQEDDIAAGLPAPPDKQRNKPLHERSAALARAHEQHLHRLRVEAALANSDVTFKPKINPLSDKIAIAKAALQGLPVASSAGTPGPSTAEGSGGGKGKSVSASTASTQRMMAEAAAAAVRRQAARDAAAKAEAELHPFAPRILPSSARRMEHMLQGAGEAVPAGGDAFLHRQAVLSSLAAKRRASLEAHLRAEDGCTFRPDIGNAEEILAITRPAMVTESDGDKIVRLAEKDAEDVAKARKGAEEEYYAQFSYHPALNANSLSRARSRTHDERHRNEGGARQKLRAAALAEAKFVSEHPFQPHLVAKEPVSGGARRGSKDSTGTGGGSLYGVDAAGAALRLAIRSDPEHVSERIASHERAKAAKLEAARKLAEYEAMQGCTFAPDTGSSKRSHARLVEQASTDGGVVVVRGLGRHLELRELTRKLDEEKRERETEAFTVKGAPQYDHLPPGYPRPPTVPQPFHLSTSETAHLVAGRGGEAEARGGRGGGEAPAGRPPPGKARAMLEELLTGDTTALLAGSGSGGGINITRM